jgi:NAD(P)H dehydrogenase (quinone)
MKHAVIFAHPNEQSFTASVAQTYAQEGRRAGHEIVVRDLYRLKFDPLLKLEELPRADFAPAPDVAAERDVLRTADIFVLVYPLWLNTPPAMMKGYLERVFGFGFAYGGKGESANPLLTGRKLLAFSSSGAPVEWVERTGALDAIHALFDNYFATLCGMDFLGRTHFGQVVPGATGDFIQARLAEVQTTFQHHFGRKP